MVGRGRRLQPIAASALDLSHDANLAAPVEGLISVQLFAAAARPANGIPLIANGLHLLAKGVGAVDLLRPSPRPVHEVTPVVSCDPCVLRAESNAAELQTGSHGVVAMTARRRPQTAY